MWKLPIKAHSVFTIKIHAVCACVFFPSAGSFLHDLCTAVWLFQVRGKQIRRSDFSYLGHTPPPQPPYHQHHHHQPSPSHSLQTYRVTDLQRKPLFTLAVILQVIKTTWSSPTISPLNARCVMTSLLPLPHTHTNTHLSTISVQAKALSGNVFIHIVGIWKLYKNVFENHIYLHG